MALKEENNSLVYEINQIENSSSFQKKVVRDYLGYISKDELIKLAEPLKKNQYGQYLISRANKN